VANAIPVKGGFTTDVETFYHVLKHQEAAVTRKWLARTAIDAPCQSFKPAGTGVMNC
jgi:hypothetical protein